jgi:hypothetical protein
MLFSLQDRCCANWHVAFFRSQAEEYDTLLPFVSGGINRGQRAFHVLPAQHKKDHLQRLREAGIDVEGAMNSVALIQAAKRGISAWVPVDTDDRVCRNGG